MTEGHGPYPYRQPEPWRPPPGPTGQHMSPWLEERLFDRRIVVLAGPLTGPVASQVAAALLTLDALGAEPVQLHISSPDGELAEAFAVVDAVDAIRAPVRPWSPRDRRRRNGRPVPARAGGARGAAGNPVRDQR